MGLFVLPGVIDADYKGEIKITVWTPQPLCFIPVGSQIAQLIPFFAMQDENQKTLTDSQRLEKGFGSTGVPMVYWTEDLKPKRPMFSCKVCNSVNQEITVNGLIDTGADVTIIAVQDWPLHWDSEPAQTSVTGIGGHISPYQSKSLILIVGPENRAATLKPLLLPIPVTLWGREALSQWNVRLQNFI